MRKLTTHLFEVFIIIPGAFLMVSCKKGDQPVSVGARLTGTKWQLDALYITDSPYVQRTNFTSQYYSSCELTDIYEFRKDSILSRTRADTTTTCMHLLFTLPDDGATWYLDSADTHLLIGKQNFFNTYRYDCKIIKLDKNNMELLHYFRNYFDEPSAYIFSFRAK